MAKEKRHKEKRIAAGPAQDGQAPVRRSWFDEAPDAASIRDGFGEAAPAAGPAAAGREEPDAGGGRPAGKGASRRAGRKRTVQQIRDGLKHEGPEAKAPARKGGPPSVLHLEAGPIVPGRASRARVVPPAKGAPAGAFPAGPGGEIPVLHFDFVPTRRSRKHLVLGLCCGFALYLGVVGGHFVRYGLTLLHLKDKFSFDIVDEGGDSLPLALSGAMVEPEAAPPPPENGMVQPGEEVVTKAQQPVEEEPPEEAEKGETPPPPSRSTEDLSKMMTDWNAGVERVRQLNVGPLKAQLRLLDQMNREGRLPPYPIFIEVNFRLGPDCTVSNVRLRQSTGNAEVDAIALRIVPEVRQLCSVLDLLPSESVNVRAVVDAGVFVEIIYDAPDEATARAVVTDLTDMRTALIGSLALLGKTRDVQHLMGLEIDRNGVHIIARGRARREDVEKLLLRFIGSPK